MPRKPVNQAELLQVRTALSLQFPNCFVPKGAMKRPLKIGISKDLMGDARKHFPGMSVRMLKIFISDYCSGHNYYVALRAGSARVDLNGSFSGFVTEEAEQFARRQIARIKSGKAPQRRMRLSTVSTVGEAAARVLERAVPEKPLPPQTLEEKLAMLEHYQFAASQSDNFYYTSGRKAADDAEIEAVKKSIKDRSRKETD